MTEPHGPLDAALDLIVYLPVGLAVTAAEEVPKLAAKGRSQLGGRLQMAKVVGQFAVSQARRQVESRLSQMASAPPAPAFSERKVSYEGLSSRGGPGGGAGVNGNGASLMTRSPSGGFGATPGSAAASVDVTTIGSVDAGPSGPARGAPGTGPSGPGTGSGGVAGSSAPAAGRAGSPAAGSPAAGNLAIPGYDSLSASQVVQRLAGLASAELDAVEAYEQAHRARRTILNRIGQLRAG